MTFFSLQAHVIIIIMIGNGTARQEPAAFFER